jgi:outer membrane immunogenic protein
MRRRSPGLLVGMVVAASAVATSAMATAAFAADLPAPGPAPAAPAYHPAIYDWSGIYVGGQIGAGMMNDTFTQTTTTPLLNAGTATKTNPWSVVGGPEAGFNIEFAPVVIGVEGTWTASYLSGTQVQPSLSPGASVYTTSASHWFATATGRIGYAANDILFYVKGGGAWMRATYSEQPYSFNGYNVMQSINASRSGFTVGGGFEYGLNENLSLKVEYDFFDFGTQTYNFSSLSFQPVTGGTTPVALPVAVKSYASLLTVGVNYRFNWR